MMRKNILWTIFMVAFSSFFAAPFKKRVFYFISDYYKQLGRDTVYAYGGNFRIKNGAVIDCFNMENCGKEIEILSFEEKSDSIIIMRLDQPIYEIMELENGKMVLKEQRAIWIPYEFSMYKNKDYVWEIFVDFKDGRGKFSYAHGIDSADLSKVNYPVKWVDPDWDPNQ